MQVSGDEKYTDKPDKNIYSHVCEAAHYLLLGGGQGYAVIETPMGASWGGRRFKVKRSIGGHGGMHRVAQAI